MRSGISWHCTVLYPRLPNDHLPYAVISLSPKAPPLLYIIAAGATIQDNNRNPTMSVSIKFLYAISPNPSFTYGSLFASSSIYPEVFFLIILSERLSCTWSSSCSSWCSLSGSKLTTLVEAKAVRSSNSYARRRACFPFALPLLLLPSLLVQLSTRSIILSKPLQKHPKYGNAMSKSVFAIGYISAISARAWAISKSRRWWLEFSSWSCFECSDGKLS